MQFYESCPKPSFRLLLLHYLHQGAPVARDRRGGEGRGGGGGGKGVSKRGEGKKGERKKDSEGGRRRVGERGRESKYMYLPLH